MYLFSYGSNTLQQLATRVEHELYGEAAFLSGYRRVFRGWSHKWDGGVASLKKESGGVVYGSLVEVSPIDLEYLDRYEGVPAKYKRNNVMVTTDDGRRVKAVAYVATSRTFNEPSDEYICAVAKTIGEFWSEGGRPVTIEDIRIS